MNEKSNPKMFQYLDNEQAYPVGRVEEVLRYIDSKYVDKINSDSLSEIAIQKIIESLDPHSIYLTAAEMVEVNDDLRGKFKGIGIETIYISDTVNITATLPNSPAHRNGILPFDQIITINGEEVAGKGMAFNTIRERLKGNEKSKSVTLGIKRMGYSSLKEIMVPLEEIQVKSISHTSQLSENIGYIKIDQFSNGVYSEFMKSLEYLFDTVKVKHLVIDVRDNPGGLLPEVTKMINQLFKEKDRLIVYTENANGDKSEFKTNGKVFYDIDKVVVIQNGNSASASEILSGTIQDWDRGVIVGNTSFGKGLVQEQYDLSNGGALRLTVSRYYTPSGRSIQRDYKSQSFEAYRKGMNPVDTTSQLSTLILNRKIYAYEGIEPDEKVVLDTLPQTLYQYDDYEFVYRLLLQNIDLRKGAKEKFAQYIIDNHINRDETENESISKIRQRLEAYHTLIIDGKKSYWNLTLLTDPYIKRAIDVINTKYATYINIHEN